MYVSRMRSHPDAQIIPFEYDHCYRGYKKFFRTHKPCLSRVLGMKPKMLNDGLETLLKFLTNVKHGDTIEHVTGKFRLVNMILKNYELIDILCVLDSTNC